MGLTEHRPAGSCKDLVQNNPRRDGIYWLQPSRQYPPFQAYCDGQEGWTLIMKIDGTTQTFAYNKAIWFTKETYQEDKPALDTTESKLQSYWTLPFSELRLSMTVSGVTRHITVNYQASSLYDVIADNTFKPTSVGKLAWRQLVDGSSMQNNCDKEGFNAAVKNHARARIGIISNEQNDCISTDSAIGFGMGHWSYETSCGNVACCTADNGDKDIPAFGYIMAR